jgi:hypothetical protein
VPRTDVRRQGLLRRHRHSLRPQQLVRSRGRPQPRTFIILGQSAPPPTRTRPQPPRRRRRRSLRTEVINFANSAYSTPDATMHNAQTSMPDDATSSAQLPHHTRQLPSSEHRATTDTHANTCTRSGRGYARVHSPVPSKLGRGTVEVTRRDAKRESYPINVPSRLSIGIRMITIELNCNQFDCN